MIAVTRAKRSSSLPSHLGSLFLICCQIGLLILVVGQRANAGDERKIPPPKRVPEQERKIVYLMDMPAEDEPVITDVVDRLADELPDTIPLADVARMVLDVLALTPISDQVEMGKILKKYSVVELLYFNRYDVRRCSRGEIEARKDVCAQIRGELDSDNLSTRNNLFRYCSHCAQLFESKCSRQTDRIFHDRIIKDEANVSRLLRLGELFEKINQFVMKTAGDKRKDESKRDIVKFINKKGLPEVQLAYYTCADVLEELPDYLYFKKNIQLNYDYLQNQFDKYKLIHKKGWPIRSDKSPAHNQADVIAEAVARCDDLVEAFNEYKNKLTRGGQNKREPKMEQQKKVQKDRQRGDGEKKMKKNSREGEVVQKKKVQLEEEPKKKVQKKKIGQEKVLKDGQKKRPKKVEEESEDEEDEEEDEDEDEEEEDEEEEDEEEVEEEDEEEDEEEEEEENEPRKVQKKSGQEKFLKDRQKKRPKKVEEESEDEEEEDEPRKVQKKKKGQEKVLKDGQKKRPKKVEEYSEEEEEEDEPRKVQKKKKKGQEKVLKDGQKKRPKKVEEYSEEEEEEDEPRKVQKKKKKGQEKVLKDGQKKRQKKVE